MAGKAVPLEKSLRRRDPDPEPEETPDVLSGASVARFVAGQAARETVYFLQDVAMEIPFHQFAGRVKVLTFEALRLLALSDLFDEMDDDQRCSELFGGNPTLHPEKLRRHACYNEMFEIAQEALRNLSAGETPEEWLDRVAGRTRRSLDRLARDNSDVKTAGRAAAEIVDRHSAKPARNPPEQRRIIDISPETVESLAGALNFFDQEEEKRSSTESPEVEETP